MFKRPVSFQMKEADNFDALLKGIRKGDSAIRKAITEHIGIILRTWCKRNKNEITWMMRKGKIETEFSLHTRVTDDLYSVLKDDKSEIKNYKHYQDFIIEKGNQYLADGYASFNKALIGASSLPWQLLEKTMWKYAVKWLADRNIFNREAIRELHYGALEVLFEKIKQQSLQFNQSSELKSYYFKILEFKWKEFIREKGKSHRYTDKIPELFYSTDESGAHPLTDKIREYIKQLEPDEQYILKAYYFFEKKLTEIAEDLELSPENCRVIKHRALRKLYDMIPANYSS